jgi:molybdate transport system substrate-binding protein
MTGKARIAVVVAILMIGVAACGNDSSSPNDASKPPPKITELLVAGASDLRPAFEEIGARFTKVTGTHVTFSFGSSGQLAQQVTNGAPFDVFASASVDHVDQVLASGHGDPKTKTTYAFGRITIWTSDDTENPPKRVSDLRDARFSTIAIANPGHAPYGVAAGQALKTADVYDAVEDRLVYGENVSDALRLATSGNADVAIVALSLSLATPDGQYTLIPAKDHEPLEQALVVLATASNRKAASQEFVAEISSPAGRRIMSRYGFRLPGDKEPTGTSGISGGGV